MAEPVPPAKCDDEQGPESVCKRIKLCQNQLTPNEVKHQVFSNELIIAQILEHLPFESVLSFRLLSKAWCKEASKSIQAHRRMLRFDFGPPTVPGKEHHDSRYFRVIRKASAEEFIRVALRSSPKIFTRFSFPGNQLIYGPISGFLETYGPFIVEVEMEWSGYADVRDLSVFREVLFFALPNLRILHLNKVPTTWQPAAMKLTNIFPPYLTTQIKFNPTILERLVEVNLDLNDYALISTVNLELSYKGIDTSYHLLRNILEIAPNIEKIPCLELVVLPPYDFTSLTSLRDEISKINRKNKDKNILKGVKLLNFSGLSFLQHNILFKEGIFLESLILNTCYVMNWEMPPSNLITVFEKILDDQKSSLKFLHIQIQLENLPSVAPVLFITERFIKLPKLGKLQEIKIYLGGSRQVIPSPDSLGDNLPNLHTVSFFGGSKGFRLNDEEIYALRSQGGINKTVKVLKLEGTVHTPSFLEWTVGLFPNVKHLAVSELSEVVYPTLWGTWPEMETFHVQNATNLKDVDSVFTGMKAKTCQKVLSELSRSVNEDLSGKENNFSLWYSDRVGFNPNIAPAITRWKKLRKLYINYTNKELEPENEASRYISDVTGCMAFSKMKNLQELVVAVVGNRKISTHCRKVLESQMSYVNISYSIITQM